MDQYTKMTETPVSKLVLTLAVPTILTMLVTNIYNMADTAFVGQLGNSASGAVGVVFGFMALLQAVGFMFGQGSGSIISRLLGKKQADEASCVASTSFFGAFLVGLIILVIGFFFLDELVIFLGSTQTIAPFAKIYCSYILFAAPFMISSFVMNNILRYEGKAALGMVGMLSGGLLNILGDYVFIFLFNMGIGGAGLSTALSQLISFSMLLSMFLRKKCQCSISIKNIILNVRFIGNIITTGFPSLIRQGLGSLSTVLLNLQAGTYGDEAVSAMSITSRIVMFVLSIAIGIGQGFQPVSGFNYGAGKYERVKKAYKFTCIFAEIAIAVLVGLVLIFKGKLLVIFRDDATVVEIAGRALFLQCISMLFMPISVVTEMQLQSTGQKLQASILSGMRGGIIFIPLLLLLSYLRGLYGIQEAQPLAYVLSVVPAFWFIVRFFNREEFTRL